MNWTKIALCTDDGRFPARDTDVCLCAGSIFTNLSLEDVDRPGCADPKGLLRVRLQFNDREGIGYEYDSNIDVESLLPGLQSIVILSERPVPVTWDFAISKPMNCGGSYRFEEQNGPPVTGEWKINTVTVYMNLAGKHVETCLLSKQAIPGVCLY